METAAAVWGPPSWLSFPAGINLRGRVIVRAKDSRTRGDCPDQPGLTLGNSLCFAQVVAAVDKGEAGIQWGPSLLTGFGQDCPGPWGHGPGTSSLE